MDDINLIYQTYNLPEIKREGITDIEYNHRCKYLRLYIRLIKRCQSMTEEELSGYKEKHHILPKTLGGTNIKTNLVYMPIRYHIMAHIVIIEVYPESDGLRRAILLLIREGKSTQEERSKSFGKFSTRHLARIRTEANQKLRELGRSEEYRKRMSEAQKGKRLTEEHKRHISEGGKGQKRSEETKRNISNALKGRKMSEETRKKLSESSKRKYKEHPELLQQMSERQKGRKLSEERKKQISLASQKLAKDPEYRKKISDAHKKKLLDPEYKKLMISRVSKPRGLNPHAKKVISPDGIIYDCIMDAAEAAGIKHKRMRSWLNGRTKNNHGWSFYKEDNN